MLTYLEFLMVFVATPIIVLALLTMLRDEKDIWWDRNAFIGLMIILFLAFSYTTPWDNLMIEHGVWWYGEDATLIHFWEAPLGEYLFFILQPILTAFFLFHITKVKDVSLKLSKQKRILGVSAGILVMALGALGLTNDSTFYAGSILFWAGPILSIQWGFGWHYLVENFKIVLAAVMIPTIYLWIIDAYAIYEGIWTISETYTTGLTVGVMPVEEMLFFLVTNVFVVQGLVMYQWVSETEGVRSYFGRYL